jgi:hypothetical protein
VVSDGVRGALLSDDPEGTVSTLAGLDDDAYLLDEAATHPDAIPLCDAWVPVGDSPRAWVETPRGSMMPAAAHDEAVRTEGLVEGAGGRLARLRDALEGLPEKLTELPERLEGLRSRGEFWRDTVELAAVAFRGIVADGVLRDGLAALDRYDLREWLGAHNADPETLERSALLRAIYDAAFA